MARVAPDRPVSSPDKRMIGNSTVLLVRNVSAEDTGTYTCSTNRGGMSQVSDLVTMGWVEWSSK